MGALLAHFALSRRRQAIPYHWPSAEVLAMPLQDSTAPATNPLSSWSYPLALQGPAHREQEAAAVKPDSDLAPGRKARGPKEGGPPASKHSAFYQTLHAGMQGKRHVLLALEIPGKPDHFTVLRPSTGPAVKPMKLDELNSRSALPGCLAQLGSGEGFGSCMHAQLCQGRCASACPGWSTPWPAARCTVGFVQRLGHI